MSPCYYCELGKESCKICIHGELDLEKLCMNVAKEVYQAGSFRANLHKIVTDEINKYISTSEIKKYLA